MKRNRIFFFILLIIAALLLFAGCSDNKKPSNPPETAQPEPTEEPSLYKEVTPENGAEVILVPKGIYDWYSSYKTEADYFSTAKITETVPDNYSVPVSLSWTFDGAADSYTVRYGLKSDLSDGTDIECASPEAELKNLFVASVYYWQITAKTPSGDETSKILSFKTAETMRLLDVKGLQNARDMGGVMTSFGLPIKQGLAYRTGNPELLTTKSQEYFTETFGIKTEIDLRYAEEIKGRTESFLGEGVQFISLPSSQYFQLFSVAYPGSFKSALLIFADPESYPIDFHCSAGRDRTGTLAAFIYALCGVDEVSIVRDYEATFLKNATNIDLPNETCEEKLGGYFLPFLSQLKITFGTDDLTKAAERMALSAGLTESDINAIRRSLLGDEYKDQKIDEWNPEFTELPKQDAPYMFWEGADIAEKLAAGCLKENIKSIVASGDRTYSAITTNGLEGSLCLFKGITDVQTAPVVAVRYRTSDLKSGSFFEVIIDSKNGESQSGGAREDLIIDGEWHVLVINLAEKAKNYNGKSAKVLRLDLFNKAAKNQTIDYSFIGFFTDTESAYKYFGINP